MKRKMYLTTISAIVILFVVIPTKLCQEESVSFKKEGKRNLTFKTLIERLNVDLPSKGDPFSKINGPSLDEDDLNLSIRNFQEPLYDDLPSMGDSCCKIDCPKPNENVLNMTVNNLIELRNVDLASKGYPFPKINGPRPHEHVCIVGAGPAGIHMAVSLKDKGYQDIKIFEKTGRVGGKSYDTQLNGFYRPQGTIFLTPDYFSNIVELAERYNVGDLRVLPKPGVSKHIIFRLPYNRHVPNRCTSGA